MQFPNQDPEIVFIVWK